MNEKLHINGLFDIIDEIFLREKFLKEAFDPDLVELLGLANKQVFEKFKINPSEKKYFIAGSAKLYTEDSLKQAFNIENVKLGDMDIIIPDRSIWENAGLGDKYNTRYEPSDKIEVFSIWDPRRSGEKYSNLNVRDTNEILQDAMMVDGYWFMSLQDVLDYKIQMDREKEKELNKYVKAYQAGNKIDALKRIIQALGPEKTRAFLREVNKRKLDS
jgi:hypothetical protein